MVAIDVDFDVYKALTNLRPTETVSYNDVLRDILNLGQKQQPPGRQPVAWTWKGVTLPSGTELRAEYKGKVYTAAIVDGVWTQDGKIYGSPSAAAYAITGSGINGWVFWSVKRPGDTGWTSLGKLRTS
jgi:hypothetical protein